MSITFGGLATGLDTDSIVRELMALERKPIARLEGDRSWYQRRQAAYTTFDEKLNSFLSKIENLGSSETLRQNSVSVSNKDYFSVNAGVDALPGTSYQVEVVSLAQAQKNVSQGYASKEAQSFGTGEFTLTVGNNDPVTIVIDDSNNSLEGIMEAINDADAGVNASIINDGTSNPYRLVVTGEDVATSFSMTSSLPSYNGDVSSLLQSGGFSDQTVAYFGSGTLDLSTGDRITIENTSNSLNDIRDAINAETLTTGVTASIVNEGANFVIALDNGATVSSTNFTGGYDSLNLSETQTATEAYIRVDSIDIYSKSNSLDAAIPGLTLDLNQAEIGVTTSISVSLDEKAIKSQINDFVSGYNEVMSFISSQSASEGSSGGILGGDPGMNGIKRRIQNLMTTFVNTSGKFNALSQLGLETQRDGTLIVDDETLTNAIQDDLNSVEKLLVGEGDTKGIALQFQNYLEGKTDSIDGLLATNKKSTESTLNRIEDRIEQMELRLEKKEETMRRKFTALEQLISGMNNQSSFLAQQMDMLSNMMNKDK